MNDCFDRANIPIGKPLENYMTLVVNDDFCICKNGSIGEIFIGGDGVGRGYLFDQKTTAEKYIPNFIKAKTSKNAQIIFPRFGNHASKVINDVS